MPSARKRHLFGSKCQAIIRTKYHAILGAVDK
jgi:hypothetical protein